MRGSPRHYSLESPRSLKEALGLIEKGARPFAGGTDLMVLLEAGVLPWKSFVNLSPIEELHSIGISKTHATLGALTTYSEFLEHPKLYMLFPALAAAARVTGARAIQNRGTIGGNIANASPAADTPPGLLVYEAELELMSLRGSRWVNYCDFHTGYKKTLLEPGEIISTVRIPIPQRQTRSYFRKVGARAAQAISKIVIAGTFRTEKGRISHIRLAVGSLSPFPKRCLEVEQSLLNEKLTPQLIAHACQALRQDVTPIDDIRSTAAYRLKVAQNCLTEFLEGSL